MPKGGNGGKPPGRSPERDLPEINAAQRNLPKVSAEAWDALVEANEPPSLFLYGGAPHRIDLDADERPMPRPLTEDRLRHALARAARWFVWRTLTREGATSMEKRPAMPPRDVLKDMLADPEMPFPVLESIVSVPVFTRTGALHAEPGFHHEGRILLAPMDGFEMPAVPVHPSDADLERARTLLLDELLGDFPFIGDAERAHALAVLLLLFARELVRGPTPLHLVEKPTPGTGASLLAEAQTFPALGLSITAMTEGSDEDEWRKRLTATMGRSPRAVLIDNLRRRLDSANVAAAITATTWEDRRLGTSDNVRYPIRSAWIATANNPALSDEIARRTVRIRLNANQDRPWLRSSFRHPDLRRWMRDHHGELAWSACVLVQAWLAAGRPLPAGQPKLGMFESWSEVIGGVLAHAGVPGFLANLEEFYEDADSSGELLRAFLLSWLDRDGEAPQSVADLFPLADSIEGLPIDARTEKGQRTRLGILLRSIKDRCFELDREATVRVETAGSKHRPTWRLVRC